MSGTWSVVVDGATDGATNMATDAAMLEAAESTGALLIRLYGWDPATLSFGRHEPALRRYDIAELKRRGLATVRRPTGGRAVWHDREVTYAVAAPVTYFGSLLYTYVELHKIIAHALRELGADVLLSTERPRPVAVGAGACFASPVKGEVIAKANGRKIVGSAQVRSGSAFLQHGSILLEAGQHVVAALTTGAAEPPTDLGLGELIGTRATFPEVTGALVQSLERRLVAERAAALPGAVRERAAALRPRFADDGWTWRR